MNTKTHGDTRDPFFVKQLEDMKKGRTKARKERDKYSEEIQEVGRYLGCYPHPKAIISQIEKYKHSHEMLSDLEINHPVRFALLRFHHWFIRKTAW